MEYAEYVKLKSEIEADYQKKKEALEMVWRMSKRHENGHSTDGETYKTTLSSNIREIIKGLPDQFDANDVEEGLKAIGVKLRGRIALTNTLHRLYRRHELDVIKKGLGRTPGVYRKAQKAEGKT